MSQERATSFGEVVALYDAARPRYPERLVTDVLDACESDHPRVLDIGCGTGIASEQFVAAGCELVGVEPDASMAAIAAERLAGRGEIVVGRFEDLATPETGFDCLIAAQAWHWVDPSVGYEVAHRLLKPGGVLALFWNIRLESSDAISVELEKHYRHVIPDEADDFMAPQGARRSESEIALTESEVFGSLEVSEYHWERTCVSSEYLQLMSTHSVFRLLDASRRELLLAGAKEVIEDRGGLFTFAYETKLLLVRAF